jgi:hypothetical protein
MKGSIIAQVVRLEEHFTQFEKLGGKLTDEMWAAVPLKCISGPLKVHLNLSLNESSSYAKIREVIRAYDTATARLFRCNHHFIPFAASPRLYWYYAYEGGQDQGKEWRQREEGQGWEREVEEQRPEGQGQEPEPSTLELYVDYLMDIFIKGRWKRRSERIQ